MAIPQNQNQNLIQQAAAKKDISTAAKPATMKDYLAKMEGEIKKALPSMISPERFTRIVMSALSANSDLNKVTPASFLGAVMTSAQLGLEPNTPLGMAYIIKYGDKATFQLGYRGLMALAYRSKEITTIQAQVVYENDTFEYSFGIDPELKHVPARTNRGNPTFVYACYKTKDGGYGYEVMSVEDINIHAKKYSKAYGNSPWQTNWEEMAKKTVLKKLLKFAPLSVESANAVAADEGIRTHISDDMNLVETEYATVDANTGEIIEEKTAEGVSVD